MINKKYWFISLIILFTGISLDVRAQNEVTFKVNLKPQLKDSVFIPGRDQIYLQGNVFPLTPSKKIYLKDLAPVDSVFETSVNFPSTATGKRLQYNYTITTPDEEKTEEMSRYLKLGSGDRELDALYFNSFAW